MRLKDFKGVKPLKDIKDPELVKDIQKALGVTADGIVGHNTITAFISFKKKNWLSEPAVLGEGTARLLNTRILYLPEYQAPKDDTTTNESGSSIIVPGVGKVYARTELYEGSSFDWGEVTKGLTRIPTKDLISNIMRVARLLQEIRDFYGKPISINSWYRPPAVNKNVGGVSNSRHIVGDGVDFVVSGVKPLKVYSDISGLVGSRGGLGKSSIFTHLDARGIAARWKYNNY